MKKTIMMIMLSAAALMAACGKADAPETSAAATAAAAETTAAQQAEETKTGEVPESQEIGGGSLIGMVQRIDGNRISVEVEDGKSMSFDTSRAEMDPVWTLMAGDEVEIQYEGSDPTDGMAVLAVKVSVPYEYTTDEFSTDPMLYGEITAIDDDAVTITAMVDDKDETDAEDGESYTFRRALFGTVVTKSEPKEGDYALISYLGTLDDNPVCFRICTEDAEEDEISDVFSIVGTLAGVENDVIILDAADGSEFLFTGDASVFEEAEALKGKKVMVDFTDSLRMRVTTASRITETA